LERGAAGDLPETLKQSPAHVQNIVLANNALALSAAQRTADQLGYHVLNLGAFVEGEARHVAATVMAVARSIIADGEPLKTPACIILGGETTVSLPPEHGNGGRNTEFVLAALIAMERLQLKSTIILSGGTDGEDGPTDAAGGIADERTFLHARSIGLAAGDFLHRHDSYTFFEATGDLLKTGLTNTNVMDIRIVLIAS